MRKKLLGVILGLPVLLFNLSCAGKNFKAVYPPQGEVEMRLVPRPVGTKARIVDVGINGKWEYTLIFNGDREFLANNTWKVVIKKDKNFYSSSEGPILIGVETGYVRFTLEDYMIKRPLPRHAPISSLDTEEVLPGGYIGAAQDTDTVYYVVDVFLYRYVYDEFGHQKLKLEARKSTRVRLECLICPNY